jgi:hypothetical protein
VPITTGRDRVLGIWRRHQFSCRHRANSSTACGSSSWSHNDPGVPLAPSNQFGPRHSLKYFEDPSRKESQMRTLMLVPFLTAHNQKSPFSTSTYELSSSILATASVNSWPFSANVVPRAGTASLKKINDPGVIRRCLDTVGSIVLGFLETGRWMSFC